MEPQQSQLPFDRLPGEDTSGTAVLAASEPAAAPTAAPAQREAFLRERLLAKARAGRGQQLGHLLIAATEGAWQEPSPGVRLKLLHTSNVGQSILLELSAGASYTQSAAVTHEECLVLRGDVQLGPSHLQAGDYLYVPHNETASQWLSVTGAQLFLHLGADTTSAALG